MQLLGALCNAWPTTLRFGEGPRGCRWGCFAVGGDDLRRYLPCPVMLAATIASRHLRPPAWGAIGDMWVAFNFLPMRARRLRWCGMVICVCQCVSRCAALANAPHPHCGRDGACCAYLATLTRCPLSCSTCFFRAEKMWRCMAGQCTPACCAFDLSVRHVFRESATLPIVCAHSDSGAPIGDRTHHPVTRRRTSLPFGQTGGPN